MLLAHKVKALKIEAGFYPSGPSLRGMSLTR
jgi:hypothetical protein